MTATPSSTGPELHPWNDGFHWEHHWDSHLGWLMVHHLERQRAHWWARQRAPHLEQSWGCLWDQCLALLLELHSDWHWGPHWDCHWAQHLDWHWDWSLACYWEMHWVKCWDWH